jgi:hypothetical protein
MVRPLTKIYFPQISSTEKSSFNYLLLDPRVTLDLPQRTKKLSSTEAFRCFILSIFYVGKGKRSRPYAHLHEAIKYAKSKVRFTDIKLILTSCKPVVSQEDQYETSLYGHCSYHI